MAYNCPRCSKPVQRGRSTAAGVAGGLVGALIYSAVGSFECSTCGKIPMSEFSRRGAQQSKSRFCRDDSRRPGAAHLRHRADGFT